MRCSPCALRTGRVGSSSLHDSAGSWAPPWAGLIDWRTSCPSQDWWTSPAVCAHRPRRLVTGRGARRRTRAHADVGMSPCCAELARGDSQAWWRASGDDQRHPATDFPCLPLHGCWSDPPILAFSLSIGKGLMTISMPDRFRLAAPRGHRRRIGMAIGLLEQSRLASCPRPGRTKSTPLTRRRIAVWRLEWPPRVARARRDGRDGSCANGRPRDVGHRCERWRALERERDAAFEPPLASQVLLGIKQLEPSSQVLLRRPDCVRGHFQSSWCRGVCHPRIKTPAGPKKGQCLSRGRRGDPFSARVTS